MSSKTSKAQPKSPVVRRSKRLQEQLRNAIAVQSQLGAGLPQDALQEQLPNAVAFPPSVGAGLPQDPEVLGERASYQPRKEPVLQHPQPNPQHASSLKNFVDPLPLSPYPAESRHRFVLQWLQTVGFERSARCRSESHLYPAEDSLVRRRSTKSAPAMGGRQDAASRAMSPSSAVSYPESNPTEIRSTSSSKSSSPAHVEQATYRSVNLMQNHIYLRSPYDPLPAHIADLVAMARKPRQYPGRSLEEIRRDVALRCMELRAGEPDVQSYFNKLLPPGLEGPLKRIEGTPMLKHAVPNDPLSKHSVSGPKPDMIYGYNRSDAFTASQQAHLSTIGHQINANTYDLLCPFFVLEFKGDKPPHPGSLWVATNQCLGASASCVNMADRLNCQLRQCKDITVHEVNTAAFSIATNGTEARIFITWKHDSQDFYMQRIRGFYIQEPEQFLEFCKYIGNILDWGLNQRLRAVGDSLDILLEDSRKRTSEVAKSRPPSGSASSSGRSKLRKT